jgi:outer membrane protein
MRKLMFLAALAAATAISSPAMAGNPEGNWQVKLLGTGVLADGKITGFKLVDPGLAAVLPPSVQTNANSNVVPTLAIEYFFNKSISVETICCFTQHHINGAGGIAGTRIVDHVLILPATVTAKFHLDAGPIKPYVGAGPALFLIFGEKPGADLRGLGGASTRLSNELGVALQAGVDIPINDKGLGISLDAKKYFIDTTLHVKTAGGTEVLTTKHKLDPWVLSAGVSFRF